jgi:glycosyltransferase involved in cell wall biosynthesis
MFEGQPISILEAYASACLVLATGQDGIRDVFTDAVNGVEILQRCPKSIAATLTRLSRAPGEVVMIATKNHQVAKRSYRVARFTTRMDKILSDTATRNES